MRLTRLQLSNFRCYGSLDIQPSARLNVLYGENAQGKTSVLEAIRLLATTRSLRAGREAEMIRQNEEMAHVQAELYRDCAGEADLMITVLPSDRKNVRINGTKRPRVLDLLGQLNVVFFGSPDLDIVAGEPADRRHFLNVEISQVSPRYVGAFAQYKKVLEQRNRLLRDLRERPRNPVEAGLNEWTEQLAEYGAQIFEKRQFYISMLAPLAEEAHRALTAGREGLEIRYLPGISLPGQVRESSPAPWPARINGPAYDPPECMESPLSATESIAEAFRRQLAAAMQEELRRGGTVLGPQRDDAAFLVNGRDARIYASQGQQRTVALALKLAEYRLLEKMVQEPPVLLLDDVMSDLDDARRSCLLQWVEECGQTFITGTSLRAFPPAMLAEGALFLADKGMLQRTN